jgi:hypothetical protein
MNRNELAVKLFFYAEKTKRNIGEKGIIKKAEPFLLRGKYSSWIEEFLSDSANFIENMPYEFLRFRDDSDLSIFGCCISIST